MKIVYHFSGCPDFFDSLEKAVKAAGDTQQGAAIRGTAITERLNRWGKTEKYCATFYPSNRALNKARAKVK